MTSEDNRLWIKYNKNLLSSTEILKDLMGTLDVTDFKIKEVSIEDIVKRIYRNEV